MVGAFWKSLPECKDFDPQKLGFLLLDTQYFLDSFFDIKAADIFSEFPRLQLCEIKDVIDQKGEDLGTRLGYL